MNKATLESRVGQTATESSSLGLFEVTLAAFVPIRDQEILNELCTRRNLDRVEIHVVAIGSG